MDGREISSFLYRSVPLCTFQISNKFCDLSLLHWPLLRAFIYVGGGGSVVRKIYCTGPWKLTTILLYMPLKSPWALEISFSQGLKSLNFQGPTPPTCPHIGPKMAIIVCIIKSYLPFLCQIPAYLINWIVSFICNNVASILIHFFNLEICLLIFKWKWWHQLLAWYVANNADDNGLEIALKYIQPNYVRCHLFGALFVIYSFDDSAKLQ
jgi:hypothetical protein